jgi:uncharacterized tellurite resistance protein B-like protein
MEFVDWVKELAPKPHDLGYRFPDVSLPAQIRAQRDDTFLPEAPPAARTAPADRAERTKVTGHLNKTARLDQINVAIDYRDAEGNQTRRPITIQEISAGDGIPVINALCHMRGAIRTFRLDRIEAFITQDGEVIAPAHYLRDVFSIDANSFTHLDKDDAGDPLLSVRKARDALRPMLSLLVLMAKADGQFHQQERDAILTYAEQELIEMERLGQIRGAVATVILNQLAHVVRQLRPTIESVEYYVERIGKLDSEAQGRFWKTVRKVMFADGRFAEEEWKFEAMIEGMRSE